MNIIAMYLCFRGHCTRCPNKSVPHLKVVGTPYDFGSWTLHLRTLDLRMLYLRHFIFGQLNLRSVTPSDISPSGCYTFGMFHLRDVSPLGSYTFGSFTFGKLHLWTFHLRTSSETLEGVILRNCNFPKVKHLKF